MRTLFAAAVLMMPLTALAQEDEAGCKDHPAVPRYPGFNISACTTNDFNSIEFRTGDETTVTKEGKFWSITYSPTSEKEHSCVEIFRNYANAFKKAGGKVTWVDPSSCNASMMMPIGKSERWMNLNLANGVTLNTLEIIEVKAMEQHIEVSAADMLAALDKDGFIALHGILFDTGKGTIKPESEPLLAEIVKLLTENPELRLSVEGHTDNVGKPKDNQVLSQKRADSVKKYLTGKGIDAKRLETKGWGDSKPVGDNRTEDGRASNRRVELVKK